MRLGQDQKGVPSISSMQGVKHKRKHSLLEGADSGQFGVARKTLSNFKKRKLSTMSQPASISIAQIPNRFTKAPRLSVHSMKVQEMSIHGRSPTESQGNLKKVDLAPQF